MAGSPELGRDATRCNNSNGASASFSSFDHDRSCNAYHVRVTPPVTPTSRLHRLHLRQGVFLWRRLRARPRRRRIASDPQIGADSPSCGRLVARRFLCSQRIRTGFLFRPCRPRASLKTSEVHASMRSTARCATKGNGWQPKSKEGFTHLSSPLARRNDAAEPTGLHHRNPTHVVNKGMPASPWAFSGACSGSTAR